MSKEKLQAFAEALSKSEELQKRLAAIQVDSARSTAEKLAKLSESAGTPFTAEEYLKSVAESSEEMSEAQLHTVTGGAWDPNSRNIVVSIFTLGSACAASALGGDVDKCQIRAGRGR
jgi:Nif11 domain